MFRVFPLPLLGQVLLLAELVVRSRHRDKMKSTRKLPDSGGFYLFGSDILLPIFLSGWLRDRQEGWSLDCLVRLVENRT